MRAGWTMTGRPSDVWRVLKRSLLFSTSSYHENGRRYCKRGGGRIGSSENDQVLFYIVNKLYSYLIILFRYAVHTLIQTIIFESQNV